MILLFDRLCSSTRRADKRAQVSFTKAATALSVSPNIKIANKKAIYLVK